MASSPEPAYGMGVFVVVNGNEDHCRPDAVRDFFHDRIGACRIVTSSRSYNNDKTFVTLEFSNQSQPRQAVERYNNYKVNGCHTSVSHFKSRNAGGGRGGHRGGGHRGGGGGSWGNSRYQGGGGQGYGSPGPHGGPGHHSSRRGRSFGDMHGERMRGMSPNAAARFIEQRLQEKERRQSNYKGETNTYGSRSRSRERSFSRSRSRSAPRDDYHHSHSHHYRSKSRSASRERSPYRARSPSPRRSNWRSPTPSPSHSPAGRGSLTPSHVVDEVIGSEDEVHVHAEHRRYTDSESDSGRRRRAHKHRKHRSSRDNGEPDDCVGRSVVDQYDTAEAENAQADDVPVADEGDIVLNLPVASELLPAVTQKLLNAKRESLEQEFNNDFATISSVTKLLIEQDSGIKVRLDKALRGCVRDISKRYVEEYDTFSKANVPS